jgi:hypothetical protein
VSGERLRHRETGMAFTGNEHCSVCVE